MTLSPLYRDTIDTLRHCYDTHADKFSSTRKKQRPEFDYIIDQLSHHPQAQQGLTIVEL